MSEELTMTSVRKSSTPKWLRFIATVYIYLAIFASIIVGLATQLLLWVLLFPYFLYNERFKIVIMGQAFRFWSAFFVIWTNPFWSVKVTREPKRNYVPRNTLLMTNHLSSADPWIISSTHFPWELKYVYKADLLKIPIVGWAIYLTYDLPIYFTKEKGGWGVKSGTIEPMFNRCAELQKLGIGQVVYPEGTRSKLRRLQPFKNGFFKFAIEHESEILPVVSHNNWSLWPLGESLLDIGTAYVAYGDPIQVTKDMDIEELKDKVQTVMMDLFKFCPTHNPELEQPLSTAASTRGQGIIG
ncbi:glycerol-3-phosphate acyltransferase family [Cryptosporidium canis]|uniref:Glycerol-3-phosphate acyltransferase family n=1 Tax=Cryptosporidium canis TaxID=195482 RepID=A0ABQ8P8W4_9CRYT|nr:glycerol-3-phosphate acyltransferase family [Cryptosporidium canis]